MNNPHTNIYYKTQLCKTWATEGECKYGKRCCYAHGEDEIRKANLSGRGGFNNMGNRGGYQNQFMNHNMMGPNPGMQNAMGWDFGNGQMQPMDPMGGGQMGAYNGGFQPNRGGFMGQQGGFQGNFGQGSYGDGAPKGNVPCKFFNQSGNCKWGQNCKFSH